jgi:hypothetical protein
VVSIKFQGQFLKVKGTNVEMERAGIRKQCMFIMEALRDFGFYEKQHQNG